MVGLLREEVLLQIWREELLLVVTELMVDYE
jgi:hypothetical protein